MTDTHARRIAVLVVLLLGTTGVIGVVVLDERQLLAVTAASVLAIGAFTAPSSTIVLTVIYAALLSWFRRVFTVVVGTSAVLDPLIAVLPIAVVALTAVSARRGAFRSRSRLANLVLLLGLIAVVGALNPLQGGPAVGTAGLVFFGFPLLWFFIGRGLGTDRTLRAVYLAVAWVSVGVAVYGLLQAYGTFTGYDLRWAEESGFRSLTYGGAIRPFATLTSPGEYGRFLAAGLAIWVAAAVAPPLRVRRLLLGGGVAALLGFAILLSSVRTAVVLAVLAAGAILAARMGARALTAAVAGVGVLLALVVVANTFVTDVESDSATSAFLSRQVSGLSEPFDPSSSNAGLRLTFFVDAVEESLDEPLGQGTAITTPAARRLGDDAITTETDIGDVARSWGPVGLIVYVLTLGLGLYRSYALARSRRDWLGLAALGVLLAALFQWINGGLYAIAPIVWLTLGWVDRQSLPPAEGAEAPTGTAVAHG